MARTNRLRAALRVAPAGKLPRGRQFVRVAETSLEYPEKWCQFHTRKKKVYENYSQFGHGPSKRFARLVLDRKQYQSEGLANYLTARGANMCLAGAARSSRATRLNGYRDKAQACMHTYIQYSNTYTHTYTYEVC